jgi:hypothetical protein
MKSKIQFKKITPRLLIIELEFFYLLGTGSECKEPALRPSPRQGALQSYAELLLSFGEATPIASRPSRFDLAKEQHYNDWFLTSAARLDALAAKGDLLTGAEQMPETQMSFNLQYLQLQSQMQNDNRQYTTVSNIMKTKHDTVKNSINNIR